MPSQIHKQPGRASESHRSTEPNPNTEADYERAKSVYLDEAEIDRSSDEAIRDIDEILGELATQAA